jgi:hypothetical protein
MLVTDPLLFKTHVSILNISNGFRPERRSNVFLTKKCDDGGRGECQKFCDVNEDHLYQNVIKSVKVVL